MVVITGDIHGNPQPVEKICRKYGLTADDILIILGDVGANYYLGKRDVLMKKYLNDLPPTILCIHGNHEARPEKLPGYAPKEWHDGVVYYQEEFPKLLFAKDGEIFDFDGIRCIAIGGAYSVDKYYRQARGWAWWDDEQPSAETKRYVEKQLRENKIDAVLSHTGPLKYIPVECFLPQVDQSTVDNSTEEWLDTIEDTVDYEAWYCGHWHTNKRIDKMHFLFDGVELLEDIVRRQR